MRLLKNVLRNIIAVDGIISKEYFRNFSVVSGLQIVFPQLIDSWCCFLRSKNKQMQNLMEWFKFPSTWLLSGILTFCGLTVYIWVHSLLVLDSFIFPKYVVLDSLWLDSLLSEKESHQNVYPNSCAKAGYRDGLQHGEKKFSLVY